jgi:uncharacterized protein YjbI with pentapeptide repeats
VWNSYETRTEAEQKYFSDLVQSASKTDNGTGQRVAGILLLKQYWGKAKYEVVLANALTGMLAHESDEGILDACAEAIGDAYTADTPYRERERIRTILYGDIKGSVGALMRNEEIVVAQNKVAASPLYDMRIHYFGEAVRKNWVDLKYVNLRLAELTGIHLYRANLEGAILEGANAFGRGTQLFGSDFENADLKDANIQQADARGANFKSANLKRAHLSGADLSPLQDESKAWHITSFQDACLEDAFLDEKIDARGASFRGAHLKGASLKGAELVPFKDDVGRSSPTSFVDADLSESNLEGADLEGVIFSKDTNFDGADLEGAKFSNAAELQHVKGKWKGKPIYP